MIKKSFGEKVEGIEYKDRVGAYAIIFDNADRVLVVKTSTGYFLLGGGIENNETHEECIKREALEEGGIYIIVKEFICKGDKYHWSDTLEYYMHGIGYFYIAEMIDKVCEKVEEDHELVWLKIDDCYKKLFLEHQVFAVYQAKVITTLRNYLKNKYNCHSIILYGSLSNGTETDESDIDIICFADNIKEQNDTSELFGRQLDAWIYDTSMMEKYKELAHINGGKIILDERNICNKLLDNIDEYIKNVEKLSEEQIEFQKKWLIKMLNRASKNDIEGNFRYHWLLVDSLEIYFNIKGIRYMGPKKSLNFLKENDEIALEYFNEALNTNSGLKEAKRLVEFIIK
ncbi:hypothetical protein UT300003_10720 [Clostridium sardiniense]